MEAKVKSFSNQYGTSIFCMSDGSIRLIGDCGRHGNFGFYSNGSLTISCISNDGVKVTSGGNLSYIAPPIDLGKIVQCEMTGTITFALNEENKLHYWGTVGKKQVKRIPSDKKIKKMIHLDWGAIIFVTTEGENILFSARDLHEGSMLSTLQEDLKSCGELKDAAFHSLISYLLSVNGDLTIHSWNNSTMSEVPSKRTFVYKDIEWCKMFDDLYFKSSVCGIQKLSDEETPRYYKSPVSIMFKDKDPLLMNANELSYESVYASSVSILSENGSLTQVFVSETGLTKKELHFNSPIKQFNCSLVLLESGVIIPILHYKHNRVGMILAAFPEWADDEETVFQLTMGSPCNFAYASARLRNDVEFSKKIALLGSDAMQYIDGSMRRNRNIRSIKKLYDLSKV